MRIRTFLLVAAQIAASGLADATAAPPRPDPDPARFTADIAAFEAWDRQNSAPKDAVLFVGSSSIRMWQTAESFPELAVINRGFGGSHASDVNHFAERIVLKYAPRTIVFYAGDNDLADGKSPGQVADDFQKFVVIVHARLPNTDIIYLPVKPSLARWRLWPQMQGSNALVKKQINGNPHISYVDTATPMLGNDGLPRPEIFLDDGLHMNDQGYRIWSELLRRKLASSTQGKQQ
jgi:lysophospholipase L1-like esterase